MRKILIAAFLSGACGTDLPSAPSCQQSVDHYYASGCALFRTDGTQFTALEVTSDCKASLASAPATCQDELSNLRVCFGSTPMPAKTNADCDCSAEQDAFVACH